MTFPTIAATNSGNSGANTLSHTVNLPSGIVSGNLLIASVCFDNDPLVVVWPVGWTQLFSTQQTTLMRLDCYYRVADGSEGASITVTSTSSQGSAHVSYRITGQHASTAPEAAATATGDSVSPNSPSLNPTNWGTEDTLWLALYGWDDGIESHTTYPASYTLSQVTNRWNNAAGTGIAISGRNNTVASEDPAAATISGGTRWVSSTLAIRPSSAATVVEADGSSSGTGTATGVGLGIDQATASAAGAGTATGVGLGIDQATASAAGAGTATGVGVGIDQATASAAGVATVSGDGQSTNQADGSAAGAGTATGVGVGIDQATASAAGVATVSGNSQSTNQATANATGTGDTDFRGIGVERFSGMADGTSTCDSEGVMIRLIEGSAAGAATVSGDGQSEAQADGSSDGTAIVLGIGQSEAQAMGLAEGVAIVSGVGEELRILRPLPHDDDIFILRHLHRTTNRLHRSRIHVHDKTPPFSL